jgi:hypothetical protein
MPKGHSDNLLKVRELTNAKITAALSIGPLRYNQLQDQTRIQRKRLKDRLRELIFQDIIYEHKFSIKDDASIEHNATYYLLNWNSSKARDLVNYWFDSADPSFSNLEKIQNSKFADMILERTDMQNKILMMDKSKLSKIEFKKQFDIYAKNARMLELMLICDCKIKVQHSLYTRAFLFDDKIIKVIINYLSSGYTLKDMFIKMCVDHKTPLLLPYVTLWEFIIENREKFSMITK